MFRYLAKRLLLFIPTLLLVSLLAFGLSRMAPGDPVSQYLVDDRFGNITKPADFLNAENAYRQAASTLNLDQPAFYFSFTQAAFPDTLYKVAVPFRRETLQKLIAQYGNWPQIESWYQGIRSLDLKILALPDSLQLVSSSSFSQPLRELYVAYDSEVITSRLGEMEMALHSYPALAANLGEDFDDLKKKYEAVLAEATPGLLKIPAFRWNGLDNQYHRWLSSFLKGDFGISVYERKPVREKVLPALFWTAVINLAAILLAFLLAVPLGIWSAVKRGKTFDRVATLGLFVLYSLPTFWVGTLLVIFFTTKEYGMDIFAGPGLGYIPTGTPWWEKISLAMPHLLLPILCIVYPSLAFISRQARSGMSDVLGQDYMRTARAKGLPERKVIWQHGFRNALFPVITLLASVLPAAIAGSVVIEVIFNIPGMGWLMWNAIFQKDWPIVFTILMLGSVLTIAGMLLADVLYAIVDPRVRFYF